MLVSNSLCLLATTANANSKHQQPAETYVAASATSMLRAAQQAVNEHDSNAHYKPADSTTVLFKNESLKAPQVQLNRAAVKFVRDYIKKNTQALEKVAQRGEVVFRIMEPILSKYDLPVALKYLAVVESDLKRTAVSRVGAAGPWQLMPATARELGLHVSKKWDERKHYSKSTTAAAKYLRDLYKVYGDWLLVIAAYNAGPGVINKAIRKAGSRNFWKLQYFLPAETRGHVKRFIGTHYYFEETGGETTLTKAENLAYNKKLAAFATLKKSNLEAVTTTAVASVEIASPKEALQEPVVEPLLAKDK